MRLMIGFSSVHNMFSFRTEVFMSILLICKCTLLIFSAMTRVNDNVNDAHAVMCILCAVILRLPLVTPWS